MRHARHRQEGFSLIEAVVASALLGLVTVGLMAAFTQGVSLTDRAEQVEDLSIAAGSLLEEIRTRAFEDPRQPVFGPEADETATDKTTFDDIDDFCGWVEEPVQDESGLPNRTLGDIRLEVRVWYVPDSDTDGMSDTDASPLNDNGEILFDLSSPAPSNPCLDPGPPTRFKAIEVQAVSIKHPGTGNVLPTRFLTIRFK